MTPHQRKLARHALGLPNEQRRSYRNRFHAGTGGDDWKSWMQMAGNGEAKYSISPKSESMDLFWLTHRGALAALEPGETLCPEDFPEPTTATEIAIRQQTGEGRFTTPAALPSKHEAELLVVTIEECNEVMRECFDLQQRATKLLRFGATEIQPGQTNDNAWRLGVEFGELAYMMDRLIERGVIYRNAVAHGRSRKAAKLPKFMQTTEAESTHG